MGKLPETSSESYLSYSDYITFYTGTLGGYLEFRDCSEMSSSDYIQAIYAGQSIQA